jgi:hypothetical protein
MTHGILQGVIEVGFSHSLVIRLAQRFDDRVLGLEALFQPAFL